MDGHQEVQLGPKADQHRPAALRKSQLCSLCFRDCRWLVPHMSRSPQSWLSSLLHSSTSSWNMMTDALEGQWYYHNLRTCRHKSPIWYLWAGMQWRLTDLTQPLDQISTMYGMEISAEKAKLITNNKDPVKTKITVSGQQLETVKQFKCFGAIISEDRSKIEGLTRAAQTATTLARLRPIRRNMDIGLRSKLTLPH